MKNKALTFFQVVSVAALASLTVAMVQGNETLMALSAIIMLFSIAGGVTVPRTV